MKRSHPALLTTSDVAALCNVHPETVRRWAETGQVPAIVLPGGRLRFRPADIAALLEPRRIA
jgi:excisionase family DNA binding protein